MRCCRRRSAPPSSGHRSCRGIRKLDWCCRDFLDERKHYIVDWFEIVSSRGDVPHAQAHNVVAAATRVFAKLSSAYCGHSFSRNFQPASRAGWSETTAREADSFGSVRHRSRERLSPWTLNDQTMALAGAGIEECRLHTWSHVLSRAPTALRSRECGSTCGGPRRR
jgi:hypothetical protein